MARQVKQLLYGHQVDMGGIPVRQPFPTRQIEQLDPFLLFHHHTSKIKPGSNPKTTGIGPHPHRGFSPVTFIYKGDLHHRDSRQNSQVIHSGGVQWMDVGMGIIHSERPSSTLASKGGTQEIIQLWINMPQAKKMEQPHYQAYEKEAFPTLASKENTSSLSLISGKIADDQGPVSPKLPVISIMGQVKKGSSFSLPIPQEYETILYLLDGQLKIPGFGKVEALNVVRFEKDEQPVNFTAEDDTRILLVSAKPLNEPVATYGPFVMTNQTEIMEAMRDYQQGKMGVLIEEF